MGLASCPPHRGYMGSPAITIPFSLPRSPCSSRVIQIQPQEFADANDNHASHPSPYGHPGVATSTQITTTVQAFTQCDPSGHHIVTVLPPTSQVCTSPAVLLPPADPLGSQVFTPSSSTRDLLAQLDEAKGGRECVPLPFCRWSLSDFAREKYAPLLLRTQTKVRRGRGGHPGLGTRVLGDVGLTPLSPQAVVVVLFLALLGLSLYGTTMVHDGLYLTDIVPRDTKAHAFISAQFKYFSFYNMFIVTKGGFHYPGAQAALLSLHQAFSTVKYVVREGNHDLPKMWLHYFQDWLRGEGHPSPSSPCLPLLKDPLPGLRTFPGARHPLGAPGCPAMPGMPRGTLTPHAVSPGLQATFDRDWQAGRITHDSYRNGSEDGALAYKLLIQTGNKKEPFNFNQVGGHGAGDGATGLGTEPRGCAMSCAHALLTACPVRPPVADHAAAGGRKRHHPPGHLLHLPDGVGQQRPPGLRGLAGQLLPAAPRVDP